MRVGLNAKGKKCKGVCENESVKVVINEEPMPLFKLTVKTNIKASKQKVGKVYVSL